VPVSRGELIEIGDSFRLPDLMARAGCRLREVGTTNRTHLMDYAEAIGPRSALLMKVHTSNYVVEGFTAAVGEGALATLAHEHGLPLVVDLGSGTLIDLAAYGLPHETTPRETVAAGADLVTFSGDKLLGGPQAGIIVGAEEPLSRIRAHPLMRALRVGKMTYAALEATLLEYARGRATTTVPVARMLATTREEIDVRAAALADRIADQPLFAATVVDGVSTVGGGGAPGSALPTRLLQLAPHGSSAAKLETRLRALRPAIIARIEDDHVVLDLRTVLPEQDDQLTRALTTLA